MKSKDPGPEALLPAETAFVSTEVPSGVDRRTFMMRSAVIGSAAVITGCTQSETQQTAAATAPPPVVKEVSLSPDLDVVKKSKGPVMTTSTSSTRSAPGPRARTRSARCGSPTTSTSAAPSCPPTSSPRPPALKVHLFGSLSATGKGHGTERAALAGIIGKEPATVDPLFLDELRDKPDQTFPVKLGDKTLQRLAEGHHLRRPEGRFPAPQHDDVQADGAATSVLLEQEYYSVGGGFIEWKGYKPPKKGAAEVPVRDDEGAAGARREEQALHRAGRDGERGGGLRQDRGGDQRVPRQDLERDGDHREVGPRRADERRCPGRSS